MSEQERPRRRLTLMPEVLPKPKKLDDTPSAARARTLEHMKRLVAGVTSSVAIVGCSDSPDAATSSSTKPADKTSATATATASATATATATATASATATVSEPTDPTSSATGSAIASQSAKKVVVPPRPPTGYMVVDPMPMPPPRPQK